MLLFGVAFRVVGEAQLAACDLKLQLWLRALMTRGRGAD